MKAVVTTLAFCVAALLALGMVMLYSSSSSMMQHGVRAGANYLIMQMLYFLAKGVFCFFIAFTSH